METLSRQRRRRHKSSKPGRSGKRFTGSLKDFRLGKEVCCCGRLKTKERMRKKGNSSCYWGHKGERGSKGGGGGGGGGCSFLRGNSFWKEGWCTIFRLQGDRRGSATRRVLFQGSIGRFFAPLPRAREELRIQQQTRREAGRISLVYKRKNKLPVNTLRMRPIRGQTGKHASPKKYQTNKKKNALNKKRDHQTEKEGKDIRKVRPVKAGILTQNR